MWTLRRVLAALVLIPAAAFVPSCSCVHHVQKDLLVFHRADEPRLWARDAGHRVEFFSRWSERPLQEWGYKQGATFVLRSSFGTSGMNQPDQVILEVDGLAVYLEFFWPEGDQAAHWGIPGADYAVFGVREEVRSDFRGNLSFDSDADPIGGMRFEFDMVDLIPFMEDADTIAEIHGLRRSRTRASLDE